MVRLSARSSLIIGLAGVLLSACSGDYNVGAVRALKTDGPTYFLALQQGYADVAQWKQEERNWDDSELMLAKARTAAGGAVPALETPTTPTLTALHERLIKALGNGNVSERQTVDAALAQVAYDCVARTAINPPNPEGTKSHNCMQMLTEALATLETTKAIASDSDRSAPLAIYFDANSARLTKDEEKALRDLAATIANSHPSQVVISGYSDSVGSLAANIVMAQKRVTAVYQTLLGHGVAESVMKQMVYGEEDPALSPGASTSQPAAQSSLTPEAPDAKRRRVVITLVP